MNPNDILDVIKKYIDSVEDKNSQEFLNFLDKLNALSVLY